MEEMKLLEKYYYVFLRPFQDKEDRSRRELEIIPEIVYETLQSLRYERNLHVIWYSHPDPQEYNMWDFNRIIVNSEKREILSETLLITEIMAMDHRIQPQEFEMRLQALGFQRK